MKFKGLILVALFFSLAALSLSQFSVVSAKTEPITKPITSFTSFTYMLRGRITYRIFNYVVPAANMYVAAKNLSSGDTFSARTNSAGFYTLKVIQASASAHYSIQPLDNHRTWQPAKYQKMVSKDLNGLNFVGNFNSPFAKNSK